MVSAQEHTRQQSDSESRSIAHSNTGNASSKPAVPVLQQKERSENSIELESPRLETSAFLLNNNTAVNPSPNEVLPFRPVQNKKAERVKRPLQAKGPGVIQRQYNTVAGEDTAEYDALQAFPLEHKTLVNDKVNWQTTVNLSDNMMEKLKQALDDDEDLEYVADEERKLDAYVKQLDNLTLAFHEEKLVFRKERKLRPEYKKIAVPDAPKSTLGKRKVDEDVDKEEEVSSEEEVSDEVDTDEDVSDEEDAIIVKKPRPRENVGPKPKYDIFLEIKDSMRFLKAALNALMKTFPQNKAGFSAKGRAHDITTSDDDVDDYTEEHRWVKDIKWGKRAGRPNRNGRKIYKEHKKIPEDYGVPRLSGYADLEPEAGLKALEAPLGKLVQADPKNYKKTPVYMDRKGTQESHMGSVNASGYAYLAQIPGYETARWEWLHIKGAALGGVTGASNLVVGVRDVNTQMMPVESHIKVLAGMVDEFKEDYEALNVKFTFSTPDPIAKHKVDEIRITWEMKKKKRVAKKKGARKKATPIIPEAKTIKGEAVFNPLNGSASISKDEVGIIEQELKEQRTYLTGKDEDDQ